MSSISAGLEPMSQNVPECPAAAERLSDKQRAAIELLLLGRRPSDIAAALDVDRRTVFRWRQDDTFREELARCRRELWSGAAERLRARVHPSLDVMEQHLADRYDRSRFRAAAAVLRLADLHKA